MNHHLDALGIDMERSGLFCRGDPMCQARFVGDIPIAAAARNAHEVEAHGHHHVDEGEGWHATFHDGMSRRGRSMLGRKK